MSYRQTRPLAFAAALAALLFVLSGTAAAADATPATFSSLLAQPDYHVAWKRMIAPENRVPTWLARANGPSAPHTHVRIDGKSYIFGSMCKRHACATNQFFGVFDESKRKAWGMLVTVSDAPGAVTKPNKYARYRWFGKPDARIKGYLLQEQLKQNPDWK